MTSPIIIGVDPGPTHSAAVALLDGVNIYDAKYLENHAFKGYVGELAWHAPGEVAVICIEQIKHYGTGMSVGASIFDTVEWVGRFLEKWSSANAYEIIEKIPRATIKAHLCGSAKAKDSNVRQALIDRFPATGGGATPAIGIKSKPGPLYGISKHLWSALAVAVYKHETMEK